ncbi:C40 family peptidase [Streptomonospora wellingtoniae]|uniref:C40 family peptidase n=1 Tax=Streptomonospora wellingtoniae TaxID=3075544 RepID=A0ABU2KYD4_9ACTN|nr:C40 family peptidase [Streptomonospora sp. DSM 45055]MDT0304324.1 C40 family peptidase [Streptomonospora sp. DSM 45055]
MLKLLIAAVAALIALPVLLGAIATGSPSQAPAHVDGIPDRLLQAYTSAAAELAATGKCDGMRWQILAGIGQIESDLAAGHDIDANGDITPPIIGPRLDGSGTGGNTTPHYDTDHGRWDRDTTYDRAVGPNQHLPSGWDDYGADGNNDGVADPHNADDSALASGRELCFSGGDSGTNFTDREELSSALFRYNHSDRYVADVLVAIDRFDQAAPDLGGDPASDQGQAAVAWALDQVGKPYVWGGVGPGGFDCSGLVMRAWQAAGVDIPRVTTDQYGAGTRVDRSELKPGDLLFYDTTDVGSPGPAPSHVTMYIGDGEMVNAPSTGQSVRIQPVRDDFYGPRFMGAVRPGK